MDAIVATNTGNSTPYAPLTHTEADASFLGEQASFFDRTGDRFCSSLNISFDVDGAQNNQNDLIIAAPGWDATGVIGGGRGKAHIFANPYPAP